MPGEDARGCEPQHVQPGLGVPSPGRRGQGPARRSGKATEVHLGDLLRGIGGMQVDRNVEFLDGRE